MTHVLSFAAGMRALTAKLCCHWRLKASLSIGLTVFFAVPYFTLQRWTLFEPLLFEEGWIDRRVPFEPGWVWTYQSVYALFGLPAWLSTSADRLRRHACGFVAVSLVGFATFAVLPVRCPRPEALPESGLFAFLVAYDRPLNAFPSLHCAYTTYSVLFALSGLGPETAPWTRRIIASALVVWMGAIVYSTLATKQHYFVDVLAGAGIATFVHCVVVGRGASRSSAGDVRERRVSCNRVSGNNGKA